MSIVGRINIVGFLDSTYITVAGLNHLTEFCKNIYLNLIQVKPLDKSAVRLNYPLKFSSFIAIAIIVYRHWSSF